MIRYVPGNVDGIGRGVFGNGHLSPNDFLTKSREFLQRDRSTAAPAHVEGAPRHQIPRLELLPHKIAKIVRMKQIANLKSLAAESRVLQGASKVMTCNPQREHTLIGFSKLTRASDNAAAIDDNRQSAVRRIFLAQQLGSQLRRAIVGAMRIAGKAFRNTVENLRQEYCTIVISKLKSS